MIDVNIDDFYHDVAVTLLSLYQQFPLKISLYIEDVCGPDEADEFGLHSRRHLSCIGALEWMHDESFIRYTDIAKYECAEKCTLTHKAFRKLAFPKIGKSRRLVSSIEKQESSLAYKLHQAIKDQSSIEIRDLIEEHFFN
ncbi:MAG: hypothetical protein ACJA0E_001818 [Bermanella sp.]|jgi:hypothetical protein